jgi:hypothetical protein
MLIRRQILPTTGQTLDDVTSKLKAIKGCILVIKTLTLTQANILNYLVMAGHVSTLSMFPFHNAKNFTPEDEEPVYKKSKQDFTYKIKGKKYKHSMAFDYGTTFQQIVNSFSGTDLYVIYYDHDWNLILTTDDNGLTYRGFKTSLINFEEPNFPTTSESMVKKLVIELKDSTELSERGRVIKLTYPPEIIDRLFAQLAVSMYIDHAIIHLTYKGTDINDLLSSDISIIDDYSGAISFTLFNYSGGIYSISGFDKTPTTGCLTITNSLYVARIRYSASSDIVGTSHVLFENGDACLFEDGGFVLFEN